MDKIKEKNRQKRKGIKYEKIGCFDRFITDDLPGRLAWVGNSSIRSQDVFSISPEKAKNIIAKRATEVITILKNKDVETLSTYVHPTKGLRFAQYSCLDNDNLVFKREQVRTLVKSKKVYFWGSYDGSNSPIKLTFEQYYKKFIYDVDYSQAPIVNYNKISLGGGANQCFGDHKEEISVQFFFSKHPSDESKHWRALRLTFEEKNKVWYITEIIQDTWTI